MTGDPPAAIRAALHANELDESDLHHPAMQDAPAKRTSARLAVVAAVVAVIVIAGALALALPRRTDHGAPSGGLRCQHGDSRHGGHGEFVGADWRAVCVTDRHGTVAAPRGLRAVISFGNNGCFGADDGVNAMGGKFRRTARGYVARDVMSTAVGRGSGPPNPYDRVDEALDAMIETHSPVVASVVGSTLTLHSGGIVLTLHRVSTPEVHSSGEPSPRSTRTG